MTVLLFYKNNFNSMKQPESSVKPKWRLFAWKHFRMVKIKCSKDDVRVHELAHLFKANGNTKREYFRPWNIEQLRVIPSLCVPNFIFLQCLCYITTEVACPTLPELHWGQKGNGPPWFSILLWSFILNRLNLANLAILALVAPSNIYVKLRNCCPSVHERLNAFVK
jgi:hypothetical protein